MRVEKQRLGRYRVDSYVYGDPHFGSAPDPSVNHFKGVDLAVADWLARGWSYEVEMTGGLRAASAALMRDTAMVFDRKAQRVVATITYRRGESRLPVADVLDTNTGEVRMVRVEDSHQAVA